MRATVVGLVTPHLLRIVDLASEAEKGVKVEFHLRDAVSRTMRELSDQYNAPALVAAYVEGLKTAADQASSSRVTYISVLLAASAEARSLRRD